jgi:hypothetical protein
MIKLDSDELQDMQEFVKFSADYNIHYSYGSAIIYKKFYDYIVKNKLYEYLASISYSEELSEELADVAYIGLFKAIQNWQESKSTDDFTEYASVYIDNEINNYAKSI